MELHRGLDVAARERRPSSQVMRTDEEREAMARALGYASYAELVRASDEASKRVMKEIVSR